MVHQEFGTMFFGCDGVILRLLEELQIPDANFESAGDARRAFVGAHLARDDNRGLLCERADNFECLRVHLALEGDALRLAAAIAQQDELQPAFAGLIVNPTAHGDFLTGVVGDVFDRNDFSHDDFLDFQSAICLI